MKNEFYNQELKNHFNMSRLLFNKDQVHVPMSILYKKNVAVEIVPLFAKDYKEKELNYIKLGNIAEASGATLIVIISEAYVTKIIEETSNRTEVLMITAITFDEIEIYEAEISEVDGKKITSEYMKLDCDGDQLGLIKDLQTYLK